MTPQGRDFHLTGWRSQVIHRAGCRQLDRARASSGWPFGDGKTPEQLARQLDGTPDRIRFCRTCCPGVEIAPWQERICHQPGCGLPMGDKAHVLDHHFVSDHMARLLGLTPPQEGEQHA